MVNLISESVHTSDDKDIGDIEAVSLNFIVIKQGFVNVHYYYIPVTKVEGWDGYVLWLKVTGEEVRRNYERNILPDTSRYYTKDPPSSYDPHILGGPTVIIPGTGDHSIQLQRQQESSLEYSNVIYVIRLSGPRRSYQAMLPLITSKNQHMLFV